jgi:hypothetical protein
MGDDEAVGEAVADAVADSVTAHNEAEGMDFDREFFTGSDGAGGATTGGIWSREPHYDLDDPALDFPWSPEAGGPRRIWRAAVKYLGPDAAGDVLTPPAVVDFGIGVAETVWQYREQLGLVPSESDTDDDAPGPADADGVEVGDVVTDPGKAEGRR